MQCQDESLIFCWHLILTSGLFYYGFAKVEEGYGPRNDDGEESQQFLEGCKSKDKRQEQEQFQFENFQNKQEGNEQFLQLFTF